MVSMWAALSDVLMDDCSGGYSVEKTVFPTAAQWAEPTVDLMALRTEPRMDIHLVENWADWLGIQSVVSWEIWMVLGLFQ
jgi:hypothetical protein